MAYTDCPYCGEKFHSLGIARHKAMHRDNASKSKIKLTKKQNEVLYLMTKGFVLLRSQEMREFCLSKSFDNYHVDSRVIFNLMEGKKNIIHTSNRLDFYIKEDFDLSNIKSLDNISLQRF